MRRPLILVLILVLLSACGSSTIAQPPTPGSDETPQASGSPKAATPEPTVVTPTTTIVTPEPTAITPEPTVSAAAQATVVYQALNDGSLQAIDAATGNSLALGDPTQPEQRLPWSVAPDGRTIALVTGRWQDKAGTVERASLWTVTIDGSNPRKLLDLHPPAQTEQPLSNMQLALTNSAFQSLAWTPDGQMLVVASAHEGQIDLYVVAADGSGSRRLTETPALEFQPVIAHDELVYGSASTFGTGAGWGDPGAWMLPLSGGEPRPIVGQTDPAPTAVEIAGWVGSSSVALSHNNAENTSTLWTTAPDSAPRVLYEATGLIMWDLDPASIAFGAATPNDGQIGLWSWHESDAAPAQLSAVRQIKQIMLSPSGKALVLCVGENEPALVLWHDRAFHDLGPGACDRLVWSADGRFATGSGTAPGRINDAGGTAQEQLPSGALPVGWNGADFYFFAPAEEQPDRWQLYRRADGLDRAVGASLSTPPTNPRLITSSTPLPIPTPTRVPEPTAVPTAVPAPSSAPTTQPTAQPAPSPPADAGLNQLRGRLEGLIGRWAGEHAVSVTDLQTGQTIAVNGSRPQLAACTVKIVIMMAVAQDIEAGRYTEADVAAQVRSAMGPSNTAPARELIARIGGGNIGAGLRRVNEIMWNVGATTSIITHPPGYHWEEYGYATSHGTSENRLTTDDLNLILSKLYRREALSEWATTYVLKSMTIALDWMDRPFREPLPADAQLYHKIGQLYEPENTWNDAGIVVFERGGQHYAYIISYLGGYGGSWQDSYSHSLALAGAVWQHFDAAY